MKNPFVFGKIVTGRDFLNREKERRVLLDNIRSSQNTLIYSERRVGKTSLIFQSVEDARKQGKLCLLYIDVSESKSFEDLLKRISREISIIIYKRAGSIEKGLKRLVSIFKSVRPKVEIDHEGKPSFTFQFDEPEARISEDIFNAISRLGRKQEALVVVFDEFQQIADFKGKQVASIFRARIQRQREVCYIFSGSQKRILMDMFEKEKSPFYKSCFVLGIGNIKKEKWFAFVERKFKQSGKTITAPALTKILNFCLTANSIQKLCHMCWTLSDRRADYQVVEKAIDEIVNYEQGKYEVIYTGLTGFQQKVLLSLTAEPRAEVYSEAHIKKYDLGNQASIQRAVKRLTINEIIERENKHIKFLDEYFEYWLKGKL